METRLAESVPSLRNLSPNPGVSGEELLGAAADENLTNP
jgi:hypothetical protein